MGQGLLKVLRLARLNGVIKGCKKVNWKAK